jgi:hypothetical protein
VSSDDERIPYFKECLEPSNDCAGAKLSPEHLLLVDLVAIVVLAFAHKEDLKALVKFLMNNFLCLIGS